MLIDLHGGGRSPRSGERDDERGDEPESRAEATRT